MKTLVIFYSYGGNTRDEARKAADAAQADFVEVLDKKRPGMAGAFLRCASALGMKNTPVKPLGVDLELYDHMIVMAPVWAGHPAPAINNVFSALPRGRTVEVRLVSGSGKSSCREKVEAKILSRGCTLSGWQDIKRE